MRNLAAILLLALVLVLEIVIVERYVASRGNYIFDFAQRWIGARAMLFEHKNPYSHEVTNEIQMTLYGHAAKPGAWRQSFLYPPFVALTIPHFLLPYHLALPTWIVTQQLLLVSAIWLLLSHSTDGRPQPGWLVAITIGAIASRYSLMNLGYAQFTILILFWIVITWWLWSKGHFFLAGAALTLVASKPQLALLLIPLWLTLAIAQRRWQFAIGFAAMMALLLAIPFLFVGNWIPDLLDTLRSATAAGSSFTDVGARRTSELARLLGLGLVLVVLAVGTSQNWKGRQLGFLLSLGVVATFFGTLYTHSYDLVLILIPVVYGLAIVHEMQGGWARLLELGYWASFLLLPWLLWALVPDPQRESLERWLVPLVILILHIVLAVLQRSGTRLGSPREGTRAC